MRASILLVTSTLALAACKEPEPVQPSETESDTGEPPSCLDTETPGEDIVLNFDDDIIELQLSDCVPETIIITGGGITNLTGLSELRQVGRIEIRFCPNITVLTGLHDLTRVDNFIITGNLVLPSLPNFNEFTRADHLTITGNDGLVDLGRFPITELMSLEISGNAQLAATTGLETLELVGGSVTLSDNGAIQNFTGLDGLTSVGGNLSIEDNASLTSLDGLNITSVAGDLTIVNNPELSECLVEDFVLSVDVQGATIVSGNMSDLC